MQELQIINEILSAKPNNQTLSSFNKYLNNFYDITKKIAVENERDLVLNLKAIESEMAIIAAYAELFSKHVIAVGGGFSAGKSAFVNSFLKSKDIQLPISIDPTTAIPSYVMSSDKDQIIGISKNNGVANLGKIAPDILSRLTHNADNRLDFSFNLKDILPFLVVSSEFNDPKYQNICFIDTPGYNPNSDGNRAQDFNTAKEFLANSSSLLWLIACDASGGNITEQDIEFLNSIGLENKKLYIVINKADLRAASDLEEVLENLKDTLEMEGIEYEGISLYSSAKQQEYKYDKISLFDFIYDQGQSKNSKAQVKIMENLISVYQSYERAVVTKQAYNEAIFSVAHSITVEIASIDDEYYEKQAFKINQYANNLKNEFKNSNYDDILQDLKRAFKELKGSIDEIFGSVYPWDMRANEITTKDIDIPELRKITNLDDDLPKNPTEYKYHPKTKEELRELVSDENVKLSEIDISEVSDFSDLFKDSDRRDFSGIEKWDVSHVTNMSRMFGGAENFNADISSWDVSNVTNMSHMFNGAKKFNSDISNWDVSNVTDMKVMFGEAKNFDSDISNWDVSNVTDMSGMFANAVNFDSDISDWDVSNVEDMSYMFANAVNFDSDISDWDVSNVEDMSYMFADAENFDSDISSWDVSNVEDMSYMFANAVNFDSDISDWDVSNVTDMTGMFYRD